GSAGETRDVARVPRGLRRPGTRRRWTDGPARCDDEGARALAGTRDRTLRRSLPRRGLRRSPIFRALPRRGRSARFTPRTVVARSLAQVGLWRQLKSTPAGAVHLWLEENHARLHASRPQDLLLASLAGLGCAGRRPPTIVGGGAGRPRRLPRRPPAAPGQPLPAAPRPPPP